MQRKYSLTNVFDFFRASLTLGLVPRLRDVFRDKLIAAEVGEIDDAELANIQSGHD